MDWFVLIPLIVSPVLIAGDCGFPGEPLNGSVFIDGIHKIKPSGMVYASGTHAVFQCDYKYRLSNPGGQSCGPDGRWNGTTPQCLENVARSATVTGEQLRREENKRIALITNGLINTCGNWLTNGSSLQFALSRSYHVDGIRFATRKENSRNLKNAQWLVTGSDSNDKRQPIMSHWNSSEFHDFDVSLLEHGEFTTLYLKLMVTKVNVINITLISTFDVPLCEIDIFAFQDHCGHPEVPANGQVTWSPSDYRAAYSCNAGFQLGANSSIRNCILGNWEGEQFICHAKCAQQPDISSLVLNVLFGMISISLMIGACYVRTHYQLVKRDGRGDRIPICEQVSFGDGDVRVP